MFTTYSPSPDGNGILFVFFSKKQKDTVDSWRLLQKIRKDKYKNITLVLYFVKFLYVNLQSISQVKIYTNNKIASLHCVALAMTKI